MKKIIRKIASILGWKTIYHVSAVYTRDSYVGWSNMALTLEVKPWLHQDNYMEVVDYVKSEAINPTGKPVITSITKLGW